LINLFHISNFIGVTFYEFTTNTTCT